MERTKNTRMYFAVVLTLCLSVIFGCINVQAASKKISYSKYKKIYTSFARKLQKKSKKQLYMAIVKSDEPVLLISKRVQEQGANKSASSYSTMYQYSKNKKKVVRVADFFSGPDGIKVSGKHLQRRNGVLTERVRVKKCKATGWAVSDRRGYEKCSVLYKNNRSYPGEVKAITRAQYNKHKKKYYNGKALIFNRVK